MKYLLRAALVGTSTLCALLLAETGIRLWHGKPLWLPQNTLVSRAVARFVRRPESMYDAKLGWRLRSNLDHVSTLTESSLTTGEHGIRMNQPAIRPIPQHAIMAAGDSFTEGAQVDDAETWPAQLERLLAEPVVNAGVQGYATDQIVLRAETLLPVLSPKTLVVSFLSGDIPRAGFRVYSGGQKPYFVASNGALVAMNVPVPPPVDLAPDTLEPFRRVLGYSFLVTRVMARLHVTQWAEPRQRLVRVPIDVVAVTGLLLERLKQETDDRGIRLLLLMQYQGEEFDDVRRPDHAAKVLAHARAAGIQTVDSWDAIRLHRAAGLDKLRRLYLATADGTGYAHMTRAGNALTADLVARALRDDPPGGAQAGQ